MADSSSSVPRVSVVMSVHNGEQYLREAMDSITGQTLRDFELLVMDDGSTDGTAEILKACDDARIKRLRNNARIGLTESLNRLIAGARGELIARMDADDVCHPERLARQTAFLDAHPEVGVVGSQTNIIDESGATIDVFRPFTTHGGIVWAVLCGQPFAHPSVTMRRTVLREAGGYDATFEVAQDIDLWARLLGRTRFANLAEPLVRYRTHPRATSRQRAAQQVENLARARMRAAGVVLGGEPPERLVRLLVRAQEWKPDPPLTDAEAREAMEFLLHLFDAARKGGHIAPPETDAVREDMLRQFVRIERATAAHRESIPRDELALHYWRSVLPRPLWLAVLALSKPERALEIWRERRGARTLTAVSAATRPPAASPKTTEKKQGISIVILSYRRIEALTLLLEALMRQETDGLELEIVICNNAADRRLAPSRWTRLGRALGRLPDVKIFNSSHNWKCAVRYPIATLARFETILFIDDDIIPLVPDFLARMHRTHATLGPHDILSCWNTLWVEWTPEWIDEAPVTFEQPEADAVIECDTCGAGISMFPRHILAHPRILDLSQGYAKADDMAFGPIAHLACGSRVFYMPSHGMLQMHKQHRRGALHKDPEHFADLYALFRSLVLDEGYRPVMQRNASPDSAERRAARNLPRLRFPWNIGARPKGGPGA